MVILRKAKLSDIKQIQEIEKEYYEGFSCPEKTLIEWINGSNENFIVAEVNNVIVGFIFFEYLAKISAVPFIHKLEHNLKGKYVYISEIGILNKFRNSDILQKLFDKLFEKSKKDGCNAIIWLTGSKSKHDNIELSILQKNGFEKGENVKHWEAYPCHFLDDHYLWIKPIQIT